MISVKQQASHEGQNKIIKIKAKDIKFSVPSNNVEESQTPDPQSINTITVDKQQSAQFYFTGSSVIGDQAYQNNTDDQVKIYQLNSTLSGEKRQLQDSQ